MGVVVSVTSSIGVWTALPLFARSRLARLWDTGPNKLIQYQLRFTFIETLARRKPPKNHTHTPADTLFTADFHCSPDTHTNKD